MNKDVIKSKLRSSRLMQPVRRTAAFQRRAIANERIASARRMEKLEVHEREIRKDECLFRGDKVEQIDEMMSKTQIRILPGQRFQHWIDVGLRIRNINTLSDNKPPDYSTVINSGLSDISRVQNEFNNVIAAQNKRLIESVSHYLDRIVDAIDDILPTCDAAAAMRLEKTRGYYLAMKDAPAATLEEALQRILFWSDLFWQSGHRLVGLGRLDVLLERFEVGDEDVARTLVCEFYDAMHGYYAFKSNKVALGDTGQLIVLGGTMPNGSYFSNDYTRIFISALKGHPLSDPKILLRVSSDMPRDLMQLAVECIATGVGCPLLSNDDVVIPALEDFGYSHADACNYVTSACWEPQSYGNSLELNNMADVNYATAFVNMLSDPAVSSCRDFQGVVVLYCRYLSREIARVAAQLNMFRWEVDPLTTLLTQGCLESGKDISAGGAVYNNYGVLTAGLGNAVNSLFALKTLCFDAGAEFSPHELAVAASSNFSGSDELCRLLSTVSDRYGHDDPEAISLTEDLRCCVEDGLSELRNRFGGKVKWGMSSSNYLECGRSTEATLDGRKAGDPLMTHISAKGAVAPTELVAFAGAFDYSGQKSNGNVVDFFVSPMFIHSNFDKFIDFLLASIKVGFFQMQINVVDADTLLDARKNPDRYPDLIVRVWGFSAKFVELPPEYQEVITKRALVSEGRESEAASLEL